AGAARRGPRGASRPRLPSAPLPAGPLPAPQGCKPLDKLPSSPLKQGYHRELLENLLEDHGGEPASGLLLLYPSRVFHILEVSSAYPSLTPYIGLKDIKVLVVAHDIPTRLFPDWVVAVATSPVTWPSRTIQSQSTAEVHTDLSRLEQHIPTVERELLIPAETINYLCKAEECTSPEDFLRTYLSPSQPTLDSETVWPVPSYLST
uniref:Uncharacterized protein n=1 Tax=Amazona collaria TaxID=241587 RepID=A0A8B9FPH2_9PSIT